MFSAKISEKRCIGFYIYSYLDTISDTNMIKFERSYILPLFSPNIVKLYGLWCFYSEICVFIHLSVFSFLHKNNPILFSCVRSTNQAQIQSFLKWGSNIFKSNRKGGSNHISPYKSKSKSSPTNRGLHPGTFHPLPTN